MTSVHRRESRFVRIVRAAMAEKQMSVRGLARTIDPHNVERARRNIHRWLDEGITPSRASRREVADALGLSPDSLDDDDEDDPSMREAFRLYVDLMRRINAPQRVGTRED